MTSLARVNVVLASSSPRRHELLRLIGVEHDVIPADVDESHTPGEKPDAHAERLARTKAEAVAADRPQSLIIGADTIVVVDEHVLGKPRDVADAARMLRMLSNRTHVVMTAVAVSLAGRTVSLVEKVTVTFRDLSDDQIARYIATGEPMDKAGAYGIQGYGATIVRRIDGDYFAVMGLSLVRLVDLMAELGVRYDFAR
ncbi:MAG TPA: Maf family protein [Gemmatimonadaceae bacterium]|nr:Maf family protein [Gemmatimonadaceae bacterium]